MSINIVFIREVGLFRWLTRTAIRQFYKRILRRDHRMRLPTGEWITLPIASRFASEAFITGANVDWGSEALLFSMLTGRGAFLDIGANIGYYSLYMLPRSSAVFSFEPAPQARALLEANVGHTKTEAIASAIGATEGQVLFTLEDEAELSHMSASDTSGSNQIEVEVTTVDAFVTARKLIVEAIKIDIEGHDIEAIHGAMNVLEQQQPIVLTEANATAELFALTTRISYRVFAFVRERRSRTRSFVELTKDEPTRGETKMLFLAPAHLHERFRQLVNNAKR